MKFKSKISTEEYELNTEGLIGYVRQRNEANFSRIDISVCQHLINCPELLLFSRRMEDGCINGEHLAEAYAILQDIKKCEEQWNNWKNLKEEK